MTRVPVVRFPTAKRASDLKFFLEEPLNFVMLAVIFNKSSRFARGQKIQCSIVGKNLYIRFTCSTGDAMRTNMVSKGVQNILKFLERDFPDTDVIGISGEFLFFTTYERKWIKLKYLGLIEAQEPLWMFFVTPRK
ncbi:hypothetical protein AgCh_021475 [Apium graveolens]